MNKNFILKLLSVISAVLLCLPVFVSCQKEPKKTDTTDGTTAPTTEQSDDKEGVWDYTRDPSLPDFAAMVTLNDSNLKQDFDKTGRGLVTVEQYIDGDTVHAEDIVSRFNSGFCAAVAFTYCYDIDPVTVHVVLSRRIFIVDR